MDAKAEARVKENQVLVWDLPVRIFHWLMVASFAGAWLTGDSDSWRALHVTLGYTMAALVVFRIIWGLVGTKYARFSDFVKGSSAVIAYAKSVLTARPLHFVGHNPLGAVAILAMLALTLVVAATGYAYYMELGGEWLEEAHEIAANTMMAVVIIHVVGVAVGSLLDRENLVRAMITGRKVGPPRAGISSQRWGTAIVLLAIVAGLWWIEWQQEPFNQSPSAESSSRSDDDD